MRTLVVAIAAATVSFGAARANAVHYDITGRIDGAPGWPEFVALDQAPFQINFDLDTANLIEDYSGLYLSITPANVSYRVGGLTEHLTSTDVALEVERGYPQMYFDLLNGDDRLHFRFSVTDNGLNPLYSELQDGPLLRTGTFENLALSRADIWPAGTLEDTPLNISDARITVTPVPESSSFVLAIAGLMGIASRLLAKKTRRQLSSTS
jgi:hypothetical protein